VSTDLVLLAVLMGAVTYPMRAVPLLMPGVERLSPNVLQYLRLVGPAVLASIGAVEVFVRTDAGGATSLTVGFEAVAVALAVVLAVWRRNLLAGLVAGMLLVALARAAGVA
jgi:branched-subunit amino acid transport protein